MEIILRKFAESILPREITKRNKQPMVTPISNYFREELISLSDELLSEYRLKSIAGYRKDKVRKLIEDVRKGDIEKSRSAFS